VAVSLQQGEIFCTIRLDGEINISCAVELKSILQQALSSGTSVQLDLAGTLELDITALQLLWAAERQARESKVAMAVAGPLPAALSSVVSDTGLDHFPVPMLS